MDGSAARQQAAKTLGATPRLYCLGGGEPPADLAKDLLVLLRLPIEALQTLWQVLAPTLTDIIARETEELLDVFCAATKANADELARAVKACRFVIREAAQRDVPAAALSQDLESLCPGEPLVKELVLAGYEPAKAHLRHEIVKAAVADHGKLLVGVRWRLDAVQASERGAKLQMPVALLTLLYREGTDAGRITLQVLPDMMAELRTVCERMLG